MFSWQPVALVAVLVRPSGTLADGMARSIVLGIAAVVTIIADNEVHKGSSAVKLTICHAVTPSPDGRRRPEA